MRKANTARKQRRVQIPTGNEILQKMEGAIIFAELDLSQGYLQLSLAPESLLSPLLKIVLTNLLDLLWALVRLESNSRKP